MPQGQGSGGSDGSGVTADRDATAEALGSIAAEAGRLLAAVADRRGGHRVKADGSATTDADTGAERLILDRLARSWPAIPVVAEESGVSGQPGQVFFLVDPLDGTSDFLDGGSEYSVNIALVDGTRPVACALAAPGQGRIWVAGTRARVAEITPDGPAEWRPVRSRPFPASGAVALGSRRHGDPDTDACLAALGIGTVRTLSSAAKFGAIASGEADVYVRCGPTMEWDTAAGDHLVACAGGTVVGPDGRPLAYGRADRGYLNGPFAALGDPAWAGRVALPAR